MFGWAKRIDDRNSLIFVMVQMLSDQVTTAESADDLKISRMSSKDGFDVSSIWLYVDWVNIISGKKWLLKGSFYGLLVVLCGGLGKCLGI